MSLCLKKKQHVFVSKKRVGIKKRQDGTACVAAYTVLPTVSEMRLELTRAKAHYPLKVARLPIPPSGLVFPEWKTLLSEKRDSNPRPRPWQGRALPTELFSHISKSRSLCLSQPSRGLNLLSEKRDSNPRPRPWQGRALPTELFSHDVGCASF